MRLSAKKQDRAATAISGLSEWEKVACILQWCWWLLPLCTWAVYSLATYLISPTLAMRFSAKEQDRAVTAMSGLSEIRNTCS